MNILFEEISNVVASEGTLENCSSIMKKYTSDDWKNFINLSTQSNCLYNKELVVRNEFAELYVITWLPGAQSKIHDHPEIGCIMKIVKGKLREDLYVRRDDKDKLSTYKSFNFLEINSVGFSSGNKLLHKITNVNDKDDNVTVSIHIYSKPGYIQNKYEEE